MKRKTVITKTEVKEMIISEVMLEDSFYHNGYTHKVIVYEDGKIVDKIIGMIPVPDIQLAELDYPSFDVLIKNAKMNHTLANKYIGENAEKFVDIIEEKIYS